ncbi:MAG: GNAT family N-acetyltransferase [Candidatus Kapaibacterium sp.]
MIEEAHKNDLETIVDIWEQSVKASHFFLLDDDFQKIKKAMLPNGFTSVKLFKYIANKDDIAGFVGISDKKIEMLFVKPDYFGVGIGRELLKFVIIKHGCKYVDVNEQNIHACGFYEHLGFTIFRRTETDSMGLPYPILSLKLSEAADKLYFDLD